MCNPCPRNILLPMSPTVHRVTSRPAVRKRHEDYLVTAARFAVPGTVLADECAVRIVRGQEFAVIEEQSERSGVRAERIVRRDRFGYQIGGGGVAAFVHMGGLGGGRAGAERNGSERAGLRLVPIRPAGRRAPGVV